jgi:alkylation response protein AidB-like acyl-CoA dehydrogenase
MTFSVEQREMRSVVRDLATAGGTDGELWSLGLAALLVPAERGGLGLGPVELLVVAEELGRALRGADLLTTGVLGAALLAELPGAEADRLLARIVDDGARPAVVADDDLVLGADRADVLLVIRDETLLAIDPRGPGVAIAAVPCLDETRTFASVRLDGPPATTVASGPGVAAALDRARLLARLYVAAEATGAAAWCLTAATEYATMRTQFGRPIGSFQAVKHLCADMLVDVEGSKSLTLVAAEELAAGADAAPLDVDLALLQATGALDRVSRTAMHVFGGIGFTWEHPIHRYVKRALTAGSLLEPAGAVRARVAAAVAPGRD